MDKVKISKEQAELLDDLLSRNDVKWLFSHLAEWKNIDKSTPEMAKLHHWYIENPYFVSKAMIVGYEVETPEDKVREYYNSFNDSQSGEFGKSFVKRTLDLLGIKIEGVNHE